MQSVELNGGCGIETALRCDGAADTHLSLAGSSSFITGGLALKNPLCLAPMAGVTTLPLREFFTRLGASLTHTEMVSCAGLCRGNAKTLGMLAASFDEAPLILQLFTHDADTLVRGAEAALAANRDSGDAPFAGLGINMACPMPKVTKRGAGAALLNNRGEASAMVRGLKKMGLPVWVKIRVLPKGDADETLSFIDALAEAGADNVCLHGRTAAQRYEGTADRTITALAARRFPGMMSASGDVRGTADVSEYLDMGCVLVMVARGAAADPWIFPKTLSELGFDVPPELAAPAPEDRMSALRMLGERAREVSGESQAAVLMKRMMGGVLRGMDGAAELRQRAGSSRKLDEILEIFGKAIVPSESNAQQPR